MRVNLFSALLCFALLSFASAPPSEWQSLGPKDTFAGARLSAEEVRQIIQVVEPSAFDTPESWTSELRVRRVDLGASPAVVLQGSKLLCGGTGNCQVFVLRKTHKRWASLFGEEQGPIAEAFQFGPTETNGIKDFSIEANSSASGSRRVTYKFD